LVFGLWNIQVQIRFRVMIRMRLKPGDPARGTLHIAALGRNHIDGYFVLRSAIRAVQPHSPLKPQESMLWGQHMVFRAFMKGQSLRLKDCN
jgi:hypothetical protein